MVKRKNQQDKPSAYVFGLVTIVIMMLAGLWLTKEVADMSSAAWSFSGFYSLAVVMYGGSLWLASGIVCLVSRKKSPKEYRSDLTFLGIMNIVGIVVTLFCPILYKLMIVAWLLYYGFIFGVLGYLAHKRKK